jgi:hypothetical protein
VLRSMSLLLFAAVTGRDQISVRDNRAAVVGKESNK